MAVPLLPAVVGIYLSILTADNFSLCLSLSAGVAVPLLPAVVGIDLDVLSLKTNDFIYIIIVLPKSFYNEKLKIFFPFIIITFDFWL